MTPISPSTSRKPSDALQTTDGKFSRVIILSDFDGTFSGKGIPRNVDAISAFKKEGGLFTFCTGRLPCMMRIVYPDYTVTANAPLIMCNGAIIHDPKTDASLEERFFDGRSARLMVKDVCRRFPDAKWVVYADDGRRIENTAPDDVVGDRFRKMLFLQDTEEKAIACRDYIREKFGHNYLCDRSWYTCTEVMGTNANKATGVADLRRYYREKGIDNLLVIGIGDYENDIPLLKSADFAACPENAIPAVRQISDRIFCHCDEGAVADLIEWLFRQKTLPIGKKR